MTKAILWDLDGVLVDTAPFHFQAWQELFRSLGKGFAEGDFRRTFGLRNDAILADILGELTPAEIERLAQRKEELYREKMEGRVTAIPGAMGLLRRLQQRGRKSAIVSSTTRENVRVVLGSLGLESAFEAVVAEEDAPKGKPDPQGFLVAAEKLGVAGGECVVIEDAPGGVEAAKRAGMRCIGVTTSRAREALTAADLVVDSLEEATVYEFLGI
ncbi:MAG: HAD family phosphatase [Dehalococcoidia bacterium]|nr:MAG: HAD family phosphatase [Dehalococcoidia bacterium]